MHSCIHIYSFIYLLFMCYLCVIIGIGMQQNQDIHLLHLLDHLASRPVTAIDHKIAVAVLQKQVILLLMLTISLEYNANRFLI